MSYHPAFLLRRAPDEVSLLELGVQPEAVSEGDGDFGDP
jgi:hypothetical protein